MSERAPIVGPRDKEEENLPDLQEKLARARKEGLNTLVPLLERKIKSLQGKEGFGDVVDLDVSEPGVSDTVGDTTVAKDRTTIDKGRKKPDRLEVFKNTLSSRIQKYQKRLEELGLDQTKRNLLELHLKGAESVKDALRSASEKDAARLLEQLGSGESYSWLIPGDVIYIKDHKPLRIKSFYFGDKKKKQGLIVQEINTNGEVDSSEIDVSVADLVENVGPIERIEKSLPSIRRAASDEKAIEERVKTSLAQEDLNRSSRERSERDKDLENRLFEKNLTREDLVYISREWRECIGRAEQEQSPEMARKEWMNAAKHLATAARLGIKLKNNEQNTKRIKQLKEYFNREFVDRHDSDTADMLQFATYLKVGTSLTDEKFELSSEAQEQFSLDRMQLYLSNMLEKSFDGFSKSVMQAKYLGLVDTSALELDSDHVESFTGQQIRLYEGERQEVLRAAIRDARLQVAGINSPNTSEQEAEYQAKKQAGIKRARERFRETNELDEFVRLSAIEKRFSGDIALDENDLALIKGKINNLRENVKKEVLFSHEHLMRYLGDVTALGVSGEKISQVDAAYITMLSEDPDAVAEKVKPADVVADSNNEPPPQARITDQREQSSGAEQVSDKEATQTAGDKRDAQQAKRDLEDILNNKLDFDPDAIDRFSSVDIGLDPQDDDAKNGFLQSLAFQMQYMENSKEEKSFAEIAKVSLNPIKLFSPKENYRQFYDWAAKAKQLFDRYEAFKQVFGRFKAIRSIFYRNISNEEMHDVANNVVRVLRQEQDRMNRRQRIQYEYIASWIEEYNKV